MIRTTMMVRRSATKNTRGRLAQWLGKGNQKHKNRTMTMEKEATKNIKGGPQPWQWPKGTQPGTKENDHDHSDGQEECNHEHKRVTTMMAKRRTTMNTRR
jgi:hypothetical protein